MKRSLLLVVAVISLSQVMFAATAPRKYRKLLPAPTYYIAAEVHECHDGEQVDVRGVSNVPPRAKLRLLVADFSRSGWTFYSDDFWATVGEDGLFTASLTPQKGKKFRQNLVVVIEFLADRRLQPKSVLEEVGKKGEKMLDWKNPQIGQRSGWEYYLETLARVPVCGTERAAD